MTYEYIRADYLRDVMARLPCASSCLPGCGADYLRDVMARLPMQRASQIGELLPHRWQPA
jgi:hypothetical protein